MGDVIQKQKRKVLRDSYFSNLTLDVADVAVPMRSAKSELQNTTESLRTKNIDEAVPMHKVARHLQHSIAQRDQQDNKSYFAISVPKRAPFEQDPVLPRRCPHPLRKRAYFSPIGDTRPPKKT